MRNLKMKKTILLLLAVLLLLELPSCHGDDEKRKVGKEGLVVAFLGESFSESYIKNLSPLYAENKTDEALSALTCPTIMEYNKEKNSYESRLGSITVKEEKGVTVAKIKLKPGLKFATGGSISIQDYVSTLKRVVNIRYTGKYRDFYKNPIQGLVAYRYNKEGLTLKEVPDFGYETEELLSDLDRSKYKELLFSTSIAGLYKGKIEDLSPDGRSFKEVISEDSQNPDVKKEGFFEGTDLNERVLTELSEIYSKKPKKEWMVRELSESVLMMKEEEFKKECEKKGTPAGNISGIRTTFNNVTDCKVYFEKKIYNENQVIEMLNLPIISGSAFQSDRIVGAGKYYISGFSEGTSSYLLELQNKEKEKFSILTMSEKALYPSMYLGQISAALLKEMPTEKELEEVKEKYGFELMTVGKKPVLYNKEKVTEEELQEFISLFS